MTKREIVISGTLTIILNDKFLKKNYKSDILMISILLNVKCIFKNHKYIKYNCKLQMLYNYILFVKDAILDDIKFRRD